MRIARFILVCTGLLLLIAAAALISPVTQTWWVNRALARRGIAASVGSFWATPGAIEVSDLRWADGTRRVSVATIKAEMPVWHALVDGKWAISHLVAKNFSLEMGTPTMATSGQGAGSNAGASERSSAAGAAGPAQRVGRIALGPGVTVARAELEGDVVVALPWTTNPVHAHAVLTGGDIAAGRVAEFAIDVAGSAGETLQSGVARGTLRATFSAAGELGRVEFDGSLTSPDQALPQDMTLAIGATLAGEQPAQFDVAIRRGERSPLKLSGRYDATAREFVGAWNANVTADELRLLQRSKPTLALSAIGQGAFQADPALDHIHAKGTLHGEVEGLAEIAPFLARAGRQLYTVDFEAQRAASAIEFSALRATLGNVGQPVAEFALSRPMSVDFRHRAVLGQSAASGRLTLREAPLDWVAPLGGRYALRDATLTGEFAVTAAAGDATLATTAPLSAHGATLFDGGSSIVRGLDIVVPLNVTHRHETGWLIHSEGATVSVDNARLLDARFDVKPVHGLYQSAEIKATARLDLTALRTHSAYPRLPGRMASIELSGHLGAAADISAKVQVTGSATDETTTAQIEANIDDYRVTTFRAPVTITAQSRTSALTFNGTFDERTSPRRIDLDVTGNSVDAWALERMVASSPLAPVLRVAENSRIGSPDAAAAPGVASRAPAVAGAASNAPFWNGLVGRMRLAVQRLTWNGLTLDAVEANVALAPDYLLLNGARAAFNPTDLTKRVRRSEDLEGALEPISRFTADAKLGWSAGGGYTLEGAAGVDAIEGARLFGKPAGNHKPQLEGRWSIADRISARGPTLEALVQGRTEAITLTSTGGALRLLDTSIGDALPDAPTPVSDAAAKVGSAAAWLFGMKKGALDRENRLSPRMEAVLNFTYAVRELPYDRASLGATRGSDGALHVSNLEVTAPNVRFTGTGTIAYQPKPLGDRALALKLDVAVQGGLAKQLAGTDLLAEPKDANGWTHFRDPVQLTGSLNDPNKAAWHDLLARAAAAK